MAYIGTKDPWLEHAVMLIEDTYGDNVSVESKKKDLLKFGRSEQVQTTRSTLMTLPTGTFNETYVGSDLITHVSSSSGSDTGSLRVEGHTLTGGNLSFSVQFVTLAGQTKTALTTPLARCTRLANNTATDFVGIIYAYEDVAITAGVPGTATAVHCMIPINRQNSRKGSTSTSSVDYWIVTGLNCSLLQKTAAFAEVSLETRQLGSVFTEIDTTGCSDSHNGVILFEPYKIIPKNSDVRLVAYGNANGLDIGGSIQGVLAIVV